MKIIFMGSGAFAIFSLSALADTHHEILEVVTQPDKPAGRGLGVVSCPVAQLAKERKLKLYQPASVKKSDVLEHFKNLNPDLIVVVAYGKILPTELLNIPKRGCVNIHASLLPKYRGAAPINWAIVNGEEKTGVTIQRVIPELDAGDVLASCETFIDDTQTASQLHDILAPMGAELLVSVVELIEKDDVKAIPQDPSKATFAPIMKKEDGLIDWNLSSMAVYNRVRGFKPWPGTYTHLDGKTLRIHDAGPIEQNQNAKPGTIVECDKHLLVACGRGALYLLEVQLEGKRKMDFHDFLNGHKITQGALLI